MKRILHALLVVLASFPWALGCLGFGAALLFTLAADRLWPGADHGNCWSFVGPKWSRWGGYIVVRWADDVVIPHWRIIPRSLRGRRFVPHAMWLEKWPADVEMQQTVPLKRSKNPLKTLYFRYIVRRSERPHDSTWGGL
jgi:hypothetical protein